jgi:hypothetical protein
MTDVTTLLDPTAEGVPEFVPVADRIKDLRGRRIGLLDNIKHNSEYLLAAVGEVLERQYGCQTRMVKKKTYTRPAEPHVLDALADCEAVVTSIGD